MTATAHKVQITYCAECGYEPQTLELAKALMLEFGALLSSIELIPWDGGAFDVSVDGQLIHSMTRDGGFGDSAAIKQAIRARVSG
jgi:selenoprotein W-related protein